MTPVLTAINNKAGAGKTSLVYHLAWMYEELGIKVIAADLDPQAGLTAAFLNEDQIDKIWSGSRACASIYQSFKTLVDTGSFEQPALEKIGDNLWLLPGHIGLSEFEGVLSEQWRICPEYTGNYMRMRLLSVFWQIMGKAASEVSADLILMDTGPYLGAVNRSAFLSSDYILIPLDAGLFSLRSLKSLGIVLRDWRCAWFNRLDIIRCDNKADKNMESRFPSGNAKTIGYVCRQSPLRLERPITVCDEWINQIPEAYSEEILSESSKGLTRLSDDPNCIAVIKNYHSLMFIGQEHSKPIFKLTPADGVLGSEAVAVRDAGNDYQDLSLKIAKKIGLEI